MRSCIGMAHRTRVTESPDEMLLWLREVYSGRYWGHLGIEFLDVSPGTCRARIALSDNHFNYNDVVHGGVISGLIDSAAGTAVRATRTSAEIAERPHATSDLHVQYLAGASGSELVAEARLIKAGRTAIFTDVEVFDDRRRLVARGSVTFVIAARGAPAEFPPG